MLSFRGITFMIPAYIFKYIRYIYLNPLCQPIDMSSDDDDYSFDELGVLWKRCGDGDLSGVEDVFSRYEYEVGRFQRRAGRSLDSVDPSERLFDRYGDPIGRPKPVDVDEKNGDSEETPLHICIKRFTPQYHRNDDVKISRRIGVIQLLLDKGADPLARSKYGDTPLHYASCIEQSNGVLHMILKKHPHLNLNCMNYRGQTPLSLRVRQLYVDDDVQLLLKHGADPRIADEDGRTPLHDARNDSCGILLLEHGVDVNAQTDYMMYTPLHEAVFRVLQFPDTDYAFHDLNWVETLLSYGADLDLGDYKGTTLREEIDKTEFAYNENAQQLLGIFCCHRDKIEKIREAVAMGQHKSLGVNSPLLGLKEDTIRMILNLSEGGSN